MSAHTTNPRPTTTVHGPGTPAKSRPTHPDMCSYVVFWSEGDQEFTGTTNEFPGLSYVSPHAEDAISGIRSLVSDVIADDMQAPGPSVLTEAEKVVGQRDAIHGTERVSGKIAQMWSAYLGQGITEVDVNQMMILLKVARAAHNPNHRDHYVDIAGYTYLAAEAVDDLD